MVAHIAIEESSELKLKFLASPNHGFTRTPFSAHPSGSVEKRCSRLQVLIMTLDSPQVKLTIDTDPNPRKEAMHMLGATAATPR